ncbi:MAG TPA: RNA methyltransferase substrate-binding domain-containing protein, partial [Clostridia bacterium]|nr:RNA methyltransferase substrate-binding domain-containing protein [Clostridia bacterium]
MAEQKRIVIESRSNERVKDARRLLQRKERKESGLHLIESEKLVREAIASGVRISALFVEDGFAFPVPENVPVYAVSRSVMESLCESQSPQGVVAVVETPSLLP